MKATHRVHGIPFKRTGSCNRCGLCCVNEPCGHYEVIEGLPTCLIYHTRDQKCEACSTREGKDVDHSMCIRFPEHPWLNVMRNNECSYRFTRLDEKGKASKEPLPFISLVKE